ncbi:hypothetical protein OROHE_001854 [Orobanche hederae]
MASCPPAYSQPIFQVVTYPNLNITIGWFTGDVARFLCFIPSGYIVSFSIHKEV